jgi:hypothetical protein
MFGAALLLQKIHGREAVPLVKFESQEAGRMESNNRVITGDVKRKTCLELPLKGTPYYLRKQSYLK